MFRRNGGGVCWHDHHRSFDRTMATTRTTTNTVCLVYDKQNSTRKSVMSVWNSMARTEQYSINCPWKHNVYPWSFIEGYMLLHFLYSAHFLFLLMRMLVTVFVEQGASIHEYLLQLPSWQNHSFPQALHIRFCFSRIQHHIPE